MRITCKQKSESFQKACTNSKFISSNQLILAVFEKPFAQKLTSENRWIKMTQAIRWQTKKKFIFFLSFNFFIFFHHPQPTPEHRKTLFEKY